MTSASEKLTWAALLGRWIEFARSAVALPDDAAGQAMRDSVPDIIMLQAVYFALEHLGDLDRGERALGLDRAQVLISKHTNAIHDRWSDLPIPAGITELIDDAGRRLADANVADE